MSIPKISVLMPAYNAEKFVAEAIESILNQTFTDFEFIIINDCSTDRTGEIIQEYAKKDTRIIYIENEKNLKICKTLNKGILLARGKYIARMDADDWSYPYRLEKQYVYMEENPEIGISGGTMEVCDEDMNILNKREYNLTDSEIRKKIFYYSPFCHPLTIWRKDILVNAGLYNPDLNDAEDYDLYFRIGRNAYLGNLPDSLIRYRTSSTSVSAQKGRRQEILTLYIRIKAVMEYGYSMRGKEKLYWFCQLVSIFLIPNRVKFWIFNKLR